MRRIDLANTRPRESDRATGELSAGCFLLAQTMVRTPCSTTRAPRHSSVTRGAKRRGARRGRKVRPASERGHGQHLLAPDSEPATWRRRSEPRNTRTRVRAGARTRRVSEQIGAELEIFLDRHRREDAAAFRTTPPERGAGHRRGARQHGRENALVPESPPPQHGAHAREFRRRSTPRTATTRRPRSTGGAA